MSNLELDIKKSPSKVPEGYVSVPISEAQTAGYLTINVLIKSEPNPIAGHLVAIRDTFDATVFLGCITDREGRLHQWVEIWYQKVEGSSSLSSSRDNVFNATRDRRWKSLVSAMDSIDYYWIVKTGWETQFPLPTFIDLDAKAPFHPVDRETGIQWTLCRDDSLLESLDLPSYSCSRFRYLYLEDLGKASPFVSVSPDAPIAKHSVEMNDIVSDPKHFIPLNPSGERFLVMAFHPLGLDEYVHVLNGGSWNGIQHGGSTIDPGDATSELRGDDTMVPRNGRLFLERGGLFNKMVETFHLKLRLFADVTRAVYSWVFRYQCPFLNLSLDSFRVRLADGGDTLPVLWTARCVLVRPTDVVAEKIPNSDIQLFFTDTISEISIYRPTTIGGSVSGLGTVRIRQVDLGSNDGVVIQGTLLTDERIAPENNDLLRIRLSIATGVLELCGHLDRSSKRHTNEFRFKTLGQKFTQKQSDALKSAQGISLPKTSFEIISLISSPCDLYSLGVLAARIFLVDKKQSLPVAMDELLSLAHKVAASHGSSEGLSKRIGGVFKEDDRWQKFLGPQHLIHDELQFVEGLEAIPPTLWYATLSLIIRMFPGLGPYSLCKDFSDAPCGAIHKIFEEPLTKLDDLIRRTRSLIITDWQLNSEVNSIVKGYLHTD